MRSSKEEGGWKEKKRKSAAWEVGRRKPEWNRKNDVKTFRSIQAEGKVPGAQKGAAAAATVPDRPEEKLYKKQRYVRNFRLVTDFYVGRASCFLRHADFFSGTPLAATREQVGEMQMMELITAKRSFETYRSRFLRDERVSTLGAHSANI